MGNGPVDMDVGFVPANTRRRMSTLTRLLFVAANRCASGKDTRTVFASRHGEIHRAVELLRLINAGEEVSPMSFGLSVHNAGLGLYSAFTESSAPSTAIAAGEDTFLAAIAEAAGFLSEDCQNVLCVIADQVMPDEYKNFDSADAIDFAIALHLSAAEGQTVSGNLTSGAAATAEQPAFTFLRWLLSGDRQSPRIGGSNLGYTFEKIA